MSVISRVTKEVAKVVKAPTKADAKVPVKGNTKPASAVKRATTRTVAKPVRKATAVKKVATPKKATAKASPAPKTTVRRKVTPKVNSTVYVPHPREMDEFGFVIGSDSSIIANILKEGGKDRNEINVKVIKAITKTSGVNTRGGNPKNFPSLVSSILSRLMAQGYKVESSWSMVQPTRRKSASKTV